MAITAGVASVVSTTDTVVNLSATAVTGATGPVTYQWYKSTTTGFSPDGSNLIAGATSLTLADSGNIPGTTLFYVLVAVDTGHSNDTVDYAQVQAVTQPQAQSQNQFAQSSYVGMEDQAFNVNTHSVQVDASQATPLYAGQAVKLVDSAGGIPKVVACTAVSDAVFGFLYYDVRSINFPAFFDVECALSGNVIYLWATAPVARGGKLQLDLSTIGGVTPAVTSGAAIVGWAYDKASAAGQLIRVFVQTPYVGGNVA